MNGASSPDVLPPLRDDLTLLAAAPSPDGAPAWTIHDPVRNRFFRIGPPAFEALARWHLGSPGAIAAALHSETLVALSEEDVTDLVRSLAVANLLQTSDVAFLCRQTAARRVSWLMWLIHNYLFFRVPLIRPDRFLAATLWLVRPFFGRTWRRLVIAAAVAGAFLTSRQWDVFLATIPSFASWEGALASAATLFATKVLHELGHGYTAKRHGCRVPTMGVAFLVMWPVLYTDTTDAWRLVSRKARLEIAAAGILVELSLAALSTLAWNFLPDGTVRSAAFLVATVTWISTLAINLSPFMRFDGYYLLSDALDVPNLHERAFALARWRLREILFGLGLEPPEPFPPPMARLLTVIAVVTWLYRLVVFFGIALLVYHSFFKVLGLVLFGVEIGWFIARPFVREAAAWWRLRRLMRFNFPMATTLAGLAGVIGLVLTPVTATVAVPAVWQAREFTTVFAPVPAQIEAVLIRAGSVVVASQPLLRLSAPELDSRLSRADLRIDLLRVRIARQKAAREGLDQVRVLEEELAAVQAEKRGLEENRARLAIMAPFDGRVTDLADGLIPGRWVAPSLPLALLVAPDAGELIGYVAEADLDRVAAGAAARFFPDDPALPPLAAHVKEITPVSAAVLDVPALASVFGGAVAVRDPTASTAHMSRGADALVPAEAVYRVRVVFDGDAGLTVPPRLIRGVVRIDAEARSLAGRFWRTALSVIIRETGF